MNIKVKINEKFYEVSIDDLSTRPIIAHIGDESFEVWTEEKKPIPEKHKLKVKNSPVTGMQTSNRDRVVLAPLPGIVTQVFVQPGQQVEPGTPLLIIEAMKMKNTIRSGRSGTLASININAGELVKHHQAIFEFTD